MFWIMLFHVWEVLGLIFLVVQVLYKFIEQFSNTSVRINELHISDRKAHKLLLAIRNCVDLFVSDFLIYV